MGFTLTNFTVHRKGKDKNHGSIEFDPDADSPTTGGTCIFHTNNNGNQQHDYTLSGSNLSIDLTTKLKLSGNSQSEVDYTSMSGTVTPVPDSNGKFTHAGGGMVSSTPDHGQKDDDTWTAQASEGHHHHGHEAKA